MSEVSAASSEQRRKKHHKDKKRSKKAKDYSRKRGNDHAVTKHVNVSLVPKVSFSLVAVLIQFKFNLSH